MTDTEIIIAELRCAYNWFTKHGKNTNTAIIGICKRAVDEVNRQKAEIERLTSLCTAKDVIISSQETEIERLNKILEAYALQYGTANDQIAKELIGGE